MVREEPGIKISYDTNNKTQPMPNFYFSFDKNFTIYCYFEDYEECPDYYDHGYDESVPIAPYYFSYEPKGQIYLNTGLGYFFEIYVNDETFDSLNQSTPMYMQAVDIEYPYENKQPKFIDTIKVSNAYYLTQSNGTNAKKRRIGWLIFLPTRTNVVYDVTTEVIEYNIVNGNGFYAKMPIKLKTPIIQVEKEQSTNVVYDVTTEVIEYNIVNGNGFYAKMPIKLKTPIIQVEKEQRNLSYTTSAILEVLANIAALYGATFSTYVLLFGERATRPLLEKFMASDDPPDDLRV
ncbi:hypothetical protein Glove_166g104 [Diversispora epigaea]|uniref:Uncharacterized protein n=1 Tax=Diversispora epigaea TaxID=1348612 RepID=A0A397IWT9_9GLOM|nr:hypothetical protein Glove_166g104 [Diversispora epigaea]